MSVFIFSNIGRGGLVQVKAVKKDDKDAFKNVQEVQEVQAYIEYMPSKYHKYAPLVLASEYIADASTVVLAMIASTIKCKHDIIVHAGMRMSEYSKHKCYNLCDIDNRNKCLALAKLDYAVITNFYGKAEFNFEVVCNNLQQMIDKIKAIDTLPNLFITQLNHNLVFGNDGMYFSDVDLLLAGVCAAGRLNIHYATSDRKAVKKIAYLQNVLTPYLTRLQQKKLREITGTNISAVNSDLFYIAEYEDDVFTDRYGRAPKICNAHFGTVVLNTDNKACNKVESIYFKKEVSTVYKHNEYSYDCNFNMITYGDDVMQNTLQLYSNLALVRAKLSLQDIYAMQARVYLARNRMERASLCPMQFEASMLTGDALREVIKLQNELPMRILDLIAKVACTLHCLYCESNELEALWNISLEAFNRAKEFVLVKK